MQLLEDDDNEVDKVTTKVEDISVNNVGPKTKKSRDTSVGDSANPLPGAGTGGSDFGPFVELWTRWEALVTCSKTLGVAHLMGFEADYL